MFSEAATVNGEVFAVKVDRKQIEFNWVEVLLFNSKLLRAPLVIS
jgi:hypothetical protein